MGGRITLKDGKLYESVDGERFRVTQVKRTKQFECKQCNKQWAADGMPVGGSHSLSNTGSWLVREVPEMRWVPIRVGGVCDFREGSIYRVHHGHFQKQVTREEAQRSAPNYKAKEQTKESKVLWNGAMCDLIERDGKQFMRVTTSQDKTVDIEL